ncbi:hypothetical protein A4X03_0g3309 [Tilletia caries]|uniref:BD-FAE-like domain-containing protein n=1 Tax=Tilletia caries TaxID=13290 RepID=A0A8T8TKN3_9BASI|nr:hypothetical protein A4X03_0g3309 [Tilletia caries]
MSKSPMPTKSAPAIDGGSQLAEPRTASAGENSTSNSAVKMPSTNTGMDMSASTSTSGGSTGKSQRSRTSRFVAAFLRVSLLPVIAFGLPTWPILALLCTVPFVSVFIFPFFLALTAVLMYAVAWFSYLILAQSDPPLRSSGNGARYLPFLPYSPMRCLKINWAAFLYATTALRVAIPAVLDWSYRRVIVLGTQAGAGIVKEGVLYGSPYPGKRLDIYLPPNHVPPTQTSSAPAAANTAASRRPPLRTRKHSTVFNEPGVGLPVLDENDALNGKGGGVGTGGSSGGGGAAPAHVRTAVAPVILVLPSIIPPLTWTNKRKTYLQLALRLRRLGYCVVVPDITYFPEARIKASIIDLRLVLRWVGANISRYGGDPNKIHVMGHGFSAHLITLTLTQEAVVLSREGFLDRAYDREQRALERERERIDDRSDVGTQDGEGDWEESSSVGDGENNRKHLGDTVDAPQQLFSFPSSSKVDRGGDKRQSVADSWVDESGSASGSKVPPGYVMGATQQFAHDFDAASPRLHLADLGSDPKGKAREGRGLAFPSSSGGGAGEQDEDLDHNDDDPFTSPPRTTRVLTHIRNGSRTLNAGSSSSQRNGANLTVNNQDARSHSRSRSPGRPRGASSGLPTNNASTTSFDNLNEPATLAEAEEQISNGLNRVEIYEAEIELPPIAGVILLAGVSDVIKGFRNETDRGVEHLSVLRRAMGPSHTSCLLHSPAHLLFAAKNMLDTALLPPKFLLIHGGKDAVVPIEQSTLMKTLLVGVGISHVSLRAYRELGHAEALAALFLGMGKSSTKYAKQLTQDIVNFVEL